MIWTVHLERHIKMVILKVPPTHSALFAAFSVPFYFGSARPKCCPFQNYSSPSKKINSVCSVSYLLSYDNTTLQIFLICLHHQITRETTPRLCRKSYWRTACGTTQIITCQCTSGERVNLWEHGDPAGSISQSWFVLRDNNFNFKATKASQLKDCTATLIVRRRCIQSLGSVGAQLQIRASHVHFLTFTLSCVHSYNLNGRQNSTILMLKLNCLKRQISYQHVCRLQMSWQPVVYTVLEI